MGFRQLFSGDWTWGTAAGEAVGAFLLIFLLIYGRYLMDRNNIQGRWKRQLSTALLIFVVILVSSFISIGVSELYAKSRSSLIFTPALGIFYAFVVGKYKAMFILVGFQAAGSLAGYALVKLMTRRVFHELLFCGVRPKKELMRCGPIVLLTVFVGLMTVIDATSYGAGFALKVFLVATAFGGMFVFFGDIHFYFYQDVYDFFYQGLRYAAARKAECLPMMAKSAVSLAWQGAGAGVLIALAGVMKSIDGSQLLII